MLGLRLDDAERAQRRANALAAHVSVLRRRCLACRMELN